MSEYALSCDPGMLCIHFVSLIDPLVLTEGVTVDIIAKLGRKTEQGALGGRVYVFHGGDVGTYRLFIGASVGLRLMISRICGREEFS